MVALSDLFHGRMQATASAEVEASPGVVWQVISDIESHPNIISGVQSVKRLVVGNTGTVTPSNYAPNKGEPTLEVGTKWREVRSYKGFEEVTLVKTVTEIKNPHSFPRSVAITVTYTENGRETFKDDANTSTLAVHLPTCANDGDGHSSCIIVGTFAFQSVGCCNRLKGLFCGFFTYRFVQKQFQQEIDSIKEAALMKAG
jgi:hypothetical protein